MCSGFGYRLGLKCTNNKESVLRRWEEYFGELMNEENERERRVEEVETLEQEFGRISKNSMRKALN